MLKTILGVIFLIIVLVLGWHIAFMLLGGVIAISLGAWLLLVGTVLAFCVGILLVLFITGFGVALLGIFLAALVCAGIILFPILFPILLPLLIVFSVVVYVRRKRNVSEQQRRDF